MLRKWLEHKYTTVTWETLIMAMKNVGFTHLAEDLWSVGIMYSLLASICGSSFVSHHLLAQVAWTVKIGS